MGLGDARSEVPVKTLKFTDAISALQRRCRLANDGEILHGAGSWLIQLKDQHTQTHMRVHNHTLCVESVILCVVLGSVPW